MYIFRDLFDGKMVLDSLYHPPSIKISVTDDNNLQLEHMFEEKPLVKDFIKGTLLGVEYLWGNQVLLDTSEAILKNTATPAKSSSKDETPPQEIVWQRVRYRMKDRVLSKKNLH
jgi:stage V sporulation protein R